MRRKVKKKITLPLSRKKPRAALDAFGFQAICLDLSGWKERNGGKRGGGVGEVEEKEGEEEERGEDEQEQLHTVVSMLRQTGCYDSNIFRY